MKSTTQLATSLLAASSLLGGLASAATDVAQLPLKASVLAKPNVVFGMDDSGSMDWEILLDTASGLLYWNGATGWDNARGAPLRDSWMTPYAYLFPLGTAQGAQIYPFNSSVGQSVPPINQLAWLRSAAFNPVYYDTMATYPAWSPAYFDGSLKTYSNVSTSAAPSHPAVAGSPTLNVSADWTSSSGNFTSNGFRFYVQEGMTLPPGTVVGSTADGAGGRPCESGTTRSLTASQTVAPGRACWASIPYYPATFWHPETCTIGANCVAAPNGAGTLRRYEIRSTVATYPSGRSYAQEIQNFANWFTYYRKRKLMLAGSMGRVLENMSGLRMSVMPFNENNTLTMQDADGPNPSSNRFATAGEFYLNSMVANGTPTHQNVKNIAAQFAGNTSIVQYACQRNSMFIVTDGFSNTTSISVPSYNAATWGASRPYSTTPSGSLADLALSYYTNRLRTDLPAGRLPRSSSTAPSADLNTDLHINTYAITLGVRGSLWPANTDPYTNLPNWTTPVADDPSMIDDQWHATINGRGQMYLATNPDQTVANIRAGLEDILAQKSGQGSMTLSTINLALGDSRAYRASYNPAGWTGDVEAVEVNPSTGAVSDEGVWSGASLLGARNWTTRLIATHNGSTGVAFSAATVGATVNPGNAYGVTADVVAYLRGNRAGEGSTFKLRRSLIGGAINAEPAVDRENNVVYAATGEGMLHVFDTTVGSANAGKELWAFVPRAVLPALGPTTQRTYNFKPLLDGSPVIGKLTSGTKILVAGMGAAGRGYYALNVTSPRVSTEADVAAKAIWEFPTASDTTTQAKVGLTLGKPAIVRTGAGDPVVLVTSGYNSTHDGKGRLWVLNALNGTVIKEFVTADGSLSAEAGLTQVSPFAEPDGSVRYVYGGDLLGNVWRFDLTATVGSAAAVIKLAQLKTAGGQAQPVTAAPELMSYKGKRIVYIGTGRLLGASDFGGSPVHSMYAIADGTPLANVRTSLVQQTLNVSGSGSVTSNPVDWETQRGWFMDLPSGEHANTTPRIAYGALVFVANKSGGSDCTASSRLYVVDVLKGSKYDGADFVAWQVSGESNASSVLAMLRMDGRSVRIAAREHETGRAVQKDITASGSIPPGKNSWLEVRRR